MNHHFKCSLKKMVLAAFLTAIPLAASATEPKVVMLGKDGTSYDLALKDVDRINFSAAGAELLGNSGEHHAMNYADIDRILIGSTLSVSDLTAKGEIAVYPSVTDGPLNVVGIEPGTDIYVYDISGRRITAVTAQDSAVTLDLSDAPAGVMAVRIGMHSVKIIKK